MDKPVFTVNLPLGNTWTPMFAREINHEKCIGCGRCFRVCGRDVLQMVGIDEDGNQIPVEHGEDEDGEYEKRVMTIFKPENCVGCEACAKICPKQCYTHSPASL